MHNETTTSQTEPKLESLFGDKEKIIEAMSTGDVVEIGSINEIYPDIPLHANEVEIEDILWEHAN